MSLRPSIATVLATAILGMSALAAQAADNAKALPKTGKPDLKSAGPLAFGPSNVLFIGDPQGAAIFAIGLQPNSATKPGESFKVEAVDEKVAAALGTKASDILINDLAVQPKTGIIFLSVSRGRGPDAAPVIVTIDGSGSIDEVSLDKVPFAKVELSNAPAADAKDRRGNKTRQESITDLAFVDNQVIVAGLSNEEFASKLRAIPFPFAEATDGASVEIYHGAHGAFETRSPVRTFVPIDIGGSPHLLAAYTCTPLVKFPVGDLKPGAKIRGTTVAELGNRNRPLDMIVYTKDGKNVLLMANSSRGVMRIPTENVDKQEGITSRISDKAGISYETIEELKGVEQLDKASDTAAVILSRTADGKLNLDTIPLN